MVRADSGCPGQERQEAVGEEEDRKEREGERLLFIVLLCHHQQCHRGRSGVGREGEAELTSSTSSRSVRVCYHILPVQAETVQLMMPLKQRVHCQRKSSLNN